MTPSSTASVPNGSALALGSRVVSAAHTNRPRPEWATVTPWPKSTRVEQPAGRGGGENARLRMSQRAPARTIVQPMLPDGERKLERCTTGVPSGVVTGVDAVPAPVEAGSLLSDETVTRGVDFPGLPDPPQPQSTKASATQIPVAFMRPRA